MTEPTKPAQQETCPMCKSRWKNEMFEDCTLEKHDPWHDARATPGSEPNMCGKLLGYYAGNEVECNRPKGHDGACDHCFEIKGEVTWDEAKQVLAAEVSKEPTN